MKKYKSVSTQPVGRRCAKNTLQKYSVLGLFHRRFGALTALQKNEMTPEAGR